MSYRIEVKGHFGGSWIEDWEPLSRDLATEDDAAHALSLLWELTAPGTPVVFRVVDTASGEHSDEVRRPNRLN